MLSLLLQIKMIFMLCLLDLFSGRVTFILKLFTWEKIQHFGVVMESTDSMIAKYHCSLGA